MWHFYLDYFPASTAMNEKKHSRSSIFELARGKKRKDLNATIRYSLYLSREKSENCFFVYLENSINEV